MSRTRRRGIVWLYHLHGDYYEYPQRWVGPYDWEQWQGVCCKGRYVNNCRDGKNHNGVMGSPPIPWAKRIQARYERRHQNWAVRDGKEFLPRYRHCIRWEWW